LPTVRPQGSRLVIALTTAAALLLTSGCAARFERPSDAQALSVGEGVTPVAAGGVEPSDQGVSASEPMTSSRQLPATTRASEAPTVAGKTGGTTGNSTTGGATGASVPAGDTTGVTATSIVIGLFVPKTGAAPMPPTFDAQVQNYFDFVKTKGGINGRNVTVKVYDTGSTEAGARSAVQSAQGDHIFAAVSFDRPAVEGALVTALHNAHIPHLVEMMPPTQAVADDDAFVIGMDQVQQGKQIVDYMSHTLHKTKVAIVRENDPGTVGPSNAFTSEAKALGVTVFEKSIDAGANEYFNEVSALCSSKADATWLDVAPNVAIKFAVEYKQQCQGRTSPMVWIAAGVTWGFNLVLSPGAGAFDGAKAFSPWGGLHDPRYATFNRVNTAGQTDRDKDIGLAAWGFGQVVAKALKDAGPSLGRNSFEVAMQNLRTGSTDPVTGAAMCWMPLDFTGGKRIGSGNRTMVITVQGTGSNSIWATESNYRSEF
jgi:ABC-type branched-subunit amino acid transport system substrate-binding protein